MLVAIPTSILTRDAYKKPALLAARCSWQGKNHFIKVFEKRFPGDDGIYHRDHFYLIENPTELELILWGIDVSISSSSG